MTDLTIQILVQNNQEQLETTLASLASFDDSQIIIGNMGGELSLPYKTVNIQGPRDQVRNKLAKISKTDWQFYINPGEVFSAGELELTGKAKRVYVVTDDVITKEVRLWRKDHLQFINPVFENLQPDKLAEPMNVFLAGTPTPNCLEALLDWKKQLPQASEIDYYLACQYLTLQDIQKFISYANHFLFKESNSTFPATMIKYYLAQVQLHHHKNSHEALRNIMCCLADKPLMAEFWCVLGDCYYRAGVPEKAIEFFKVAIQLGKERITNDPYPIELKKYGEYPLKMIELCKSILKITRKGHS